MVIKNHHGTFTLSNYNKRWEFNGVAFFHAGTIFIGVKNPLGCLKQYKDGTKHFIPHSTLSDPEYVYANNFNK